MTSPITITIEGPEEIDRAWKSEFVPHLRVACLRAAMAAANEGAALAKRLVPVSLVPRGSHLRDVIYARIVDVDEKGVTTEIGAPKPYAIFVEQGTKPHTITAKSGKALRWTGPDGAVHLAKSVHHPGTKPHPFMGPAYLKAERALPAVLETEIEAVIERF
jgi:hypothetical protein